MSLFLSALLIFVLRLIDQSLTTVRALIVTKKPVLGAFIGLVESAIWILAVSQVIKDINDPFLIAAYAFGFAAMNLILVLIIQWHSKTERLLEVEIGLI